MRGLRTKRVKAVKEEALIVTVDVGRASNTGYCTSVDGRDLKPFKFDNNREGLDRFWSMIVARKNRFRSSDVMVGYESTGPYAEPLIHSLMQRPVTIVQVNPLQNGSGRLCQQRRLSHAQRLPEEANARKAGLEVSCHHLHNRLAVNVIAFKGADFGDPQPGSIGGGEDGSELGGFDGREEGEDLWHGKDFGEGFGSLGVGEVFNDSGLPRGDPFQKLERRHEYRLKPWRDFAFLGEIEEELAHFVFPISAEGRMKYLAKSRMHRR